MTKKASELNFNKQKFSASEWPVGALSQMHPKVISALFDIRNGLPDDCSLYPSPLYGAHVRNNDTGSRHSIQHGTRLSDATDFFAKREYANLVLLRAIAHPDVHGVGIYRNSLFKGTTDDYTMFHIDTRPEHMNAIWVADRETPSDSFKYFSLNRNPVQFFEVCAKDGIWQ